MIFEDCGVTSHRFSFSCNNRVFFVCNDVTHCMMVNDVTHCSNGQWRHTLHNGHHILATIQHHLIVNISCILNAIHAQKSLEMILFNKMNLFRRMWYYTMCDVIWLHSKKENSIISKTKGKKSVENVTSQFSKTFRIRQWHFLVHVHFQRGLLQINSLQVNIDSLGGIWFIKYTITLPSDYALNGNTDSDDNMNKTYQEQTLEAWLYTTSDPGLLSHTGTDEADLSRTLATVEPVTIAGCGLIARELHRRYYISYIKLTRLHRLHNSCLL